MSSLSDFADRVWFVTACAVAIHNARDASRLTRWTHYDAAGAERFGNPNCVYELGSRTIREPDLSAEMEAAFDGVLASAPRVPRSIDDAFLENLLHDLRDLVGRAKEVARPERDVAATEADELRRLNGRLNEAMVHLRVMDRPPPADAKQAASINEGRTEPGSGNPPRQRKRSITVNERKRLKLQEFPEAAGWTCQQWAAYLKCGKSTVHGTKQWTALQNAHCLAKVNQITAKRRRTKG